MGCFCRDRTTRHLGSNTVIALLRPATPGRGEIAVAALRIFDAAPIGPERLSKPTSARRSMVLAYVRLLRSPSRSGLGGAAIASDRIAKIPAGAPVLGILAVCRAWRKTGHLGLGARQRRVKRSLDLLLRINPRRTGSPWLGTFSSSTRVPPPREASCSTRMSRPSQRPAGIDATIPKARLGRARPGGDLGNHPVDRPAGLGGRWLRPADIAALGITNQRETAVVWDRRTGKAIHNAIVWQDRRTAAICEALENTGTKH